MNDATRSHDQESIPTVPMRTPGPVTGAMMIARARHPRPLAYALRAWPALPPLVLIRPALAGSPRLLAYASQVLGTDAMLCLIACLFISPLITIAPARAHALRWWYGIWMTVLGGAGLVLALAAAPGPVTERAAGDAVNWTGTVIVVLLLPMALISNKASQKLLGPEWKNWQRWMVWAVWWLVLAHLVALRSWDDLVGYGACSVPLIILRRRAFRHKVQAWRKGGYSTGGMWLVLDVIAALFLAGLITLLTEQALACARAAALAPVH